MIVKPKRLDPKIQWITTIMSPQVHTEQPQMPLIIIQPIVIIMDITFHPKISTTPYRYLCHLLFHRIEIIDDIIQQPNNSHSKPIILLKGILLIISNSTHIPMYQIMFCTTMELIKDTIINESHDDEKWPYKYSEKKR